MQLGANVVQITSSGVFLFGGLAILRLLLFSTKNVSSIRIFARGNPGAVRTALKMSAFLRIKYLRIVAGLNTPYSFQSPKIKAHYAARVVVGGSGSGCQWVTRSSSFSL